MQSWVRGTVVWSHCEMLRWWEERLIKWVHWHDFWQGHSGKVKASGWCWMKEASGVTSKTVGQVIYRHKKKTRRTASKIDHESNNDIGGWTTLHSIRYDLYSHVPWFIRLSEDWWASMDKTYIFVQSISLSPAAARKRNCTTVLCKSFVFPTFFFSEDFQRIRGWASQVPLTSVELLKHQRPLGRRTKCDFILYLPSWFQPSSISSICLFCTFWHR